jgi:hypothetical protein
MLRQIPPNPLADIANRMGMGERLRNGISGIEVATFRNDRYSSCAYSNDRSM